jgi:hypothetical protein
MNAIVMDAIKIFYPLTDTRESLDKVVLEWLDFKATNLEEKVMALERKYGMEFKEFNEKIEKEGASFNEEDDWIDWGDYIDLLEELKKYRRDILYQLKVR